MDVCSIYMCPCLELKKKLVSAQPVSPKWMELGSKASSIQTLSDLPLLVDNLCTIALALPSKIPSSYLDVLVPP